MWIVLMRAGLACLVLAIVIQAPQVQGVEEITIKQFVVKSDATQLDVCYEWATGPTPLAADRVHLILIDMPSPSSNHKHRSNEVVLEAIDESSKDTNNIFCSPFDISTYKEEIFEKEVTYGIRVNDIGGPATILAYGNTIQTLRKFSCSDPSYVKDELLMRLTCDGESGTLNTITTVEVGSSKSATVISSGSAKIGTSETSSFYMLLDVDISSPLSKEVRVCDDTITPTCSDVGTYVDVGTNEDLAVTEITVNYVTPNIQVHYSPGSLNQILDIVVLEDAALQVAVVDTITDGSVTATINTPYDAEINFVLMANDDSSGPPTAYYYLKGTVPAYSLYGQYLKETLVESGWFPSPDDGPPYEVSTNDVLSASETVYCAQSDFCYGYFSDAGPSVTEITLISENSDESTPNPKITIVSNQVTPYSTSFSQRSSEELVINKMDLLWSPDGTKGLATVCTQSLIPPTSLQSYQLVVMDTHGRYQHLPAASHVAPDDSTTICFSDIDVTTLDVNSEVVLVATRRDVNPRTVLASAEATVFLIAPQLRSLTKGSGHVTWNNPGGHSFTVRRSHTSTLLTTNLACQTCSYPFTHTGLGDGAVIVEQEGGPVKVTATIPLHTTTTTNNKLALSPEVQLTSFILDDNSDIQVCFDNSAGPITNVPDQKDIHMTCNINDKGQFNMPATQVTSGDISNIFCVTMSTADIDQSEIPLRGASLQCVFAVNDAGDPSSQLAFGQAAFTFPDCRNPSRLSDSPKSLLRLICESYNLVQPSINIAGKDYDIQGFVSSSEVSSVWYLLPDPSPPTINNMDVNICDTVKGSEVSKNLLVCAPSVGTDNTQEETQALKEIQLDYDTSTLTGSLADGAQWIGNFDLLVPGTEEVALYIGSASDSKIPSCTLSVYDDRTVALEYILVNYDGGNSLETYTYWTGSVFGYNLDEVKLTATTLETVWIRGNVSDYVVELPEGTAYYVSADVHCPETVVDCYGYFTGVHNWGFSATLKAQPSQSTVLDVIVGENIPVTKSTRSEVTIVKLTLDEVDGAPGMVFHYEGGDTLDISRAVVTVISVDSTNSEQWIKLAHTADSSSASFKERTEASQQTGDATTFVLTLQSANEDVAVAEVKFDLKELDKAGVCNSAFLVDNDGKVLRAYCSTQPSENAYPNLDASKLWAGSTHYEDNAIYFLNDTDAFNAQSLLRFCIDIEAEVNGAIGGSFQGCSESVLISDKPTESVTVSSVTLDYDSQSDKTLTVEHTPGGGDAEPKRTEIVFYWTNESSQTQISSCTPAVTETETTCTIDIYTKGPRELSIIYSATTSGDKATVVSTTTESFTDFNVGGIAITDTAAEVAWTPSSVTTYHATITLEDGGSPDSLPFTTTQVTCPEAPQLCLVRFVGLTYEETSGTKYEVSLKPMDEDKNTVISESFLMHSDSKAVTFNIRQVTRVIDGGSQKVDGDVTLQLEVISTTAVNNVANVNLVVIHTTLDPSLQYSYDATVPGPAPADVPTVYTFIVPQAVLPLDQSLTLLVLMRDTDDLVTAYSEASVTLKNMPDVKVESVGGNTGIPVSLRVDKCEPDFAVNGRNCSTTSNKEVEYFIRHDNMDSPVLLCYTNVEEGEGGSVAECDWTQQMTTYAEMTGVGASLTRPSPSPSTTTTLQITNHDFDATARGEVVYYYPGETFTTSEKPLICTGTEKECVVTASYIVEDDKYSEFNILVVDLKEDVLQSLDFLFADYQVKVDQLTVDAVEVRWRAADNTRYLISMPEGSGGAFDSTLVTCGAEEENNCRAYFISMATENNIIADVRKEDDDTGSNVVGREFKLTDTFRVPPSSGDLFLEVFEGTTTLRVCPTYAHVDDTHSSSSSDLPLYVLAVMDLQGHQLTQSEFDFDYGTPCFAALNLATLNTELVRLLVHLETPFSNLPSPLPPVVTLSAFVYLLDPNGGGSGEHLRVKQVGSNAVRVLWSNNNPETIVYNLTYSNDATAPSFNMEVTCSGGGAECGTFLHFPASSSSSPQPVSLTITEDNNQGIVQRTSLTVPMVEVPKELIIMSYEILWDDRLEVCFADPSLSQPARYELGLQKGSLYLETTTDPETSIYSDRTCVVSAHEMDVSAYIDLWILVTAFSADSDGALLASGDHTWTTIFLSSERRVEAATTSTSVVTSWHLLDNYDTIDNYTVRLSSGSNNEDVKHTSNWLHYYSFQLPVSGSYTVCVAAVKSTGTGDISSDEVCSDIITVSSDTEVDIPEVDTVEPMLTSNTSLLVTWEPVSDTEVTSFFISWNDTSPAYLAGFSRIHPASLARQHFKAQTSQVGFTIVPASSSSAEINDLEAGVTYDICVVPVKSDVVGDAKADSCSTTKTGTYTSIPAPTGLQEVGDKLTWDNHYPLDKAYSYLVEWTPSESTTAAKGHVEVTETEWAMKLDPGKWQVEVRVIHADSGSVSSPSAHPTTVEGVEIIPSQQGYRVLHVSWMEVGTVDPGMKRYDVSIRRGSYPVTSTTVYCTGLADERDCLAVFKDLNVQYPDSGNGVSIFVRVEKITDSSERSYSEQQFTLFPLEKVTGLSKTVKSSSEVVVSWQEVEGAKKYVLSLYANSTKDVLRASYEQTLPPTYTLTEEDMTSNSLTIQACRDDSHCGEAIILDNIISPPSDDTPFIVLTVLAGVLALAFIILVTVCIIKSNQAKEKVKDDLKKKEEEEKRQQEEEQRQREIAEQLSKPVYDQWGSRPLGRKQPAPQPPQGQSTFTPINVEGPQSYPMVPLNTH